MATKKTLEKILRGTSDANISFEDLRRVLLELGFSERVRGSHHIFSREGVEEILNLQPKGQQGEALPGQAGPPCYTEIPDGRRARCQNPDMK
jgi:hypothetical protein